MKKVIAAVTVCFFAVTLVAGSSFAAEQKSAKEMAKKAGKTVVNYPANVVNESANTVGTAAKNTVGVVVDTVKVTGETLTGQVDKAPEIVTTPVVKSAETVKVATEQTVMVPVEAGKKTQEQVS
ncbi:MAG: hypothetical protein HQL28_00195 [Candidatus Omnitrophica bacterium]|nr:hypothetical protein [Candidatus Omnitrophota bacterium]